VTSILLGKGRALCAICNRKCAVVGWCDACRKSYDRAHRSDDGTVLASILWAAKRARKFAERAAKSDSGGK
jgi:hypothetical protein